MEKIKPVVFKVGSSTFGVDINRVQAIELYHEIVPVPNAVACVDGLINIRGDVIPVYNLRMRNKCEDPIPDNSELSFILVNCNGELIAIMVDEVQDIRDLADEEYQDMPIICTNEKNEYIIGVANLKNCLAMIIDVDKLLSQEEMEIINKVVKE